MKIKKGLTAVGVAAALMIGMGAASHADAAGRIIVRPIVRPAFGFYYGPGPAWGYYRPWGPTYVLPAAPLTGDVKIDTKVKNEPIYVDGGYAGVTGHLKKFELKPGNHQIEIRDAVGNVIYNNTIQVIAGKTIDVKC